MGGWNVRNVRTNGNKVTYKNGKSDDRKMSGWGGEAKNTQVNTQTKTKTFKEVTSLMIGLGGI